MNKCPRCGSELEYIGQRWYAPQDEWADEWECANCGYERVLPADDPPVDAHGFIIKPEE